MRLADESTEDRLLSGLAGSAASRLASEPAGSLLGTCLYCSIPALCCAKNPLFAGILVVICDTLSAIWVPTE
jgi:hypothetical protein